MPITKELLTGSTDGRPIKVGQAATPGTQIHQAAAAGTLDEVWLWAMNTSGTDRKLSIEFGGVTAPDDLIEQTIAAEGGLTLVIPGLPVTDAVNIKAFAAVADVITIVGFVNRITE